jgi:valyl-tRNA synthetase
LTSRSRATRGIFLLEKTTGIRYNRNIMEPRYNHLEVEGNIYKKWESSGYFNPDNLPVAKNPEAEPFTIIMPPPNANGSLHAGHALFITLEDLITRYQRMRGKKALWVPGADHAGFETQIVYERKLEKEGRTRMGMDRQQLYDEIMAFTLENKTHMENQVRSLGASCDWSREKFTLDPAIVAEVQRTFVKMFNDGHVYRGKRPVNWCTKHQTSLSDVETETKEADDTLYYIKYGPLSVATVRPETIFGDVALAVNPEDARYKQYIGKELDVPSANGTLKLIVVGDDAVDKEFGTGVVKITPAHDANDFAMAMRHNLPIVEVIDRYGKLNDKTGKYQGLKVMEARKKVAEDLAALGLIEKTEPYPHTIPTCYKCGTTIEPRVMDQWFVNMKPLAEKAAAAVRENKIVFLPERYKNVFLYWMDNTIDWNISRQIAWGIQIPAWFKQVEGKEDEIQVGMDMPEGDGWARDQDVFDTWFSSGQWPLLTLGYPDGPDLKTFYPTQVMETGYDLIFRWIPRMVIFGLYLAKEVPFQTVYLHGLVLDPHGKKMSKSKGNVVNPLDLTQKYGSDALRMALVVGNPAGSDLSLSEDKVRGYRNFSTKVWNAARFVLSNKPANLEAVIVSQRDEIKELQAIKAEVSKHIDDFEFHLAAEKVYHYIWHTFADKIIEAEKKNLHDGSDAEKNESYSVLEEVLLGSLKMLHPFMPFITEEIYDIFRPEKMLMVEKW